MPILKSRLVTAGIDGCKSGWIMVKHTGVDYQFGVYPDIRQLFAENPDIDRSLIDIPVGLSSQSFNRTIDASLKKTLGVRHSTVFVPPSREAAYLTDYEAAKAKNITVTGKSLSIQAFHISRKIKEVDEYIQKHLNLQIIESHPEFCFKHLNGSDTLLSKKKSIQGEFERLSILSKYDERLLLLYEKIRGNTLKKTVTNDDIIDAMCLCLVNQLAGHKGLQILKDENDTDEKGISIGIGFYLPKYINYI